MELAARSLAHLAHSVHLLAIYKYVIGIWSTLQVKAGVLMCSIWGCVAYGDSFIKAFVDLRLLPSVTT